jgi:hypothetical protein
MKINWFKINIIWKLEDKLNNIKTYFYNKKMKKKYPDYDDNEYNCGELKHIWGVKSGDDLSGKNCNIYTMNDIEITYHRDIKKYSLGIETAYMFDENRKQNECKYLKKLLNAFTKYMNDNGLSKDYDICLFMSQPSINLMADSIEELYANFKIYVEGYCKL